MKNEQPNLSIFQNTPPDTFSIIRNCAGRGLADRLVTLIRRQGKERHDLCFQMVMSFLPLYRENRELLGDGAVCESAGEGMLAGAYCVRQSVKSHRGEPLSFPSPKKRSARSADRT